MKTEDFNRTNEELKKVIQKNNEQINISDERKRISNVNQFEYKAIETIAFSLLPYVGLVILSGVLIKNGIISSLIRTISAEGFSLIIVGGSLFVGTVGRKILEWKFRTKERLKVFTTANTQSEKIQEKVKYAVELEKAKNRNKAIQQAMNLLSSNQSNMNSLSSRYDINDRTILQTEEDAKKEVEGLSILLKDKYTELDILTTQKVLHEKFWRVRTKGQKVIDVVVAGMIGGSFTMMYGEMPLLMVRNYIAPSGLMSLFAPFIAGIVCVSGYMIKRNRDYVKAFNDLNNELGENALPNIIKEAYEEQRDLDAKIDSKIRDISILENQLQEQTRIMEAFSTGSSDKEETKELSVSRKRIIEDSQKDLMSSMDENIYAGEEREVRVEEKGLKRKPNNTHLYK